MKTNHLSKKILLLVLSLIFSVQFVYWSICQDIFWYFNMLDTYKDQLMMLGTLYIGKIWTIFFGRSILSLRFLNWLACAISLCIPYIALQDKEKRINNLHYLALGFVLMGFSNRDTFSPDSLTIPYTVCTATILLCMLRGFYNNITTLILLGFLTGISIISRFPNIVALGIVPPMLLVVYSSCGELNSIKKIAISIIKITIFVIVSLASYYIICKAFLPDTNIIEKLQHEITYKQIDTHHNLSFMIYYYFMDAWTAFGVSQVPLISIVGGYYLMRKYQSLNEKKVLTWVVGISTLYLFLWSFVDKGCFFGKLTTLTFYYILGYRCISRYHMEGRLKYLSPFIILLAISTIGMAGSDTGIYNMFPYTAIFFPILLTEGEGAASWMSPYFRKSLLYLLPVFIFGWLENGFDGIPLRRSTTLLQDGENMGTIFLPKDTVINYTTILNDIRHYGKHGHNIFYGHRFSHYMYTLTDQAPLYNCSFWMKDSWKEEISTAIDMMKQDTTIVLFYQYDNYKKLDPHLETIANTKYYHVMKYRK